jgi:DNA-binding HxlR family transcriptional regulator
MNDGVYHCPVEVTMDVIGGRWTPVVLAHLKEGSSRFSDLRRVIPDITDKMLTQRLRSLEADGIITRTVIANTPPHVRYDLTPAGRSLGPALQALHDWGQARATDRGLTIHPVT